MLKFFYNRQSSGWEYGTRYSAEETTADVLIFGASRAQQQYIPTYIEDSLHLSCYNVGRDGTPFFYHYAVLQAVLKRYTPKMIILDCEYAALKKTTSSYERLSPLLPLYSNHPEMQPVIQLRSPFEKYKFISHIYPYNSMLFKIGVANLESNKIKQQDIKGYVAMKGSLHEPLKTIDHTVKYELDSIKVNMLDSFIEQCRQRNIDLYFVCPPYYMNTIGTDYSFAVTKQKAAEKKIDFIDYSKDSMFLRSPQLFDDTVHVNFTGSKIFSAMIAGELKKRIKK
ncbi:MAG: hypothetical protein IPP72_21285 [Chitinophagaceae bacterium]|nr:hypothetical protein [Chitinophagaceae bacterium]